LPSISFNHVATGIFALAILHTLLAARVQSWSHAVQRRSDANRQARGLPPMPHVGAELLHFFGEVEAVFGLWVIVLLAAMTLAFDWTRARTFITSEVDFTEALFVVVIMAMAATRPILWFAESAMARIAALGGKSPRAWWLTILTVAPILGSLITEPAAMTIAALLLSRRFYSANPDTRLKYATLGLLFVNISIGGTLTHFAAPPVLMVARPWNWDLAFMAGHFGWKALVAIVLANAAYLAVFRRQLASLKPSPPRRDGDDGVALDPPVWIVLVHIGFLAFVVMESHYPVLFIGTFLLFLGFLQATSPYQSAVELKAPLLVGFFLAGLVTHGALQRWWIEPLLGSLSSQPLFASALVLTAFNDNALVTYLATLVPGLDAARQYAVVAGAVSGGGLTVIANAPNPAGQAILGQHFEDAIFPIGLLAGALPATIIASVCFLLL
jgi:hypothetical protein